MRIVFMGTPDFAVHSLKALLEAGHELIGVITQPDRPRGRGQKLTPSPVKTAAMEAEIPVYQPEKIKTPEFVNQLQQLSPDLIVVVAFGQLLSKQILELPRYGCINVHASLLPKYRGAAPIHWAVINGETKTGVTIMYMNEGLDSGDMIISSETDILPNEDTGSVHDKLAQLGGASLVKAIQLIAEGTAPRIPQNHDKATYAPLLKRETERIDWSKAPDAVCNLIRGLNPWPGAYTMLGEKVLKIWQARPCEAEDIAGTVPELKTASPGEILGRVPGLGFAVAASGGCIAVTEVQLQGNKRLNAEDFMNGHNIPRGTRLG